MLAAGPEGLSYLDNGNPYRSKTHAIACRELALRHLRTEPYRPRTNGKAERFIQTLLGAGLRAPSTRPAESGSRLYPDGWIATTESDRTDPLGGSLR